MHSRSHGNSRRSWSYTLRDKRRTQSHSPSHGRDRHTAIDLNALAVTVAAIVKTVLEQMGMMKKDKPRKRQSSPEPPPHSQSLKSWRGSLD